MDWLSHPLHFPDSINIIFRSIAYYRLNLMKPLGSRVNESEVQGGWVLGGGCNPITDLRS